MAPPRMRLRTASAFSLVEVLVVLVILGILLGMVTWNFSRTDLRRQSVRAAAEELAATFRHARALAMERKATFAVVFHIQNDPDSSGRVLNNRTGGHWYRILGPPPATASEGISDVSWAGFGMVGLASNTVDVDNLPPLSGPTGSSGGMRGAPYTVFQAAQAQELSWHGGAHVLPARRVRFLALSDMDYGDYKTQKTSRIPSATASYPRPWFGWFDADAGRLHPWGGYDATIPGSGFFFWGQATAPAPRDPAPVTCTHTADRRLDRWTRGQLSTAMPMEPQADTLYTSGSPRPLLDSAWRDACLVFWANGEVRWGNFMPMRHNSWMRDSTVSGTKVSRGAAERCNGLFSKDGVLDQHTQIEVGNFDRDTGGWFITLAPDTDTDQDQFPSAREALDSIMPAYRVFVSSLGQVQVIAVSRISKFDGMSAFPADESWWRNGSNMRTHFGQDRLVDGSTVDKYGTGIGEPVGRPITDFLVPEMLINRSVWMR